MSRVDEVSNSIKDEIMKVIGDYKFTPITGSTISNLELDYSKVIHELVVSENIIIKDNGSTIILFNEELLELLPLIPTYDKEVLNHQYSEVYINDHHLGAVWYDKSKSSASESSMNVGYPCDVRIKLSAPVESIKIEFTISD